MKQSTNGIRNLLVIFTIGFLFAVFSQFLEREPTSKNIHIQNFRYGKEPSVIRCNRGDTLKLTFSSKDTGHSFFLEEFDMDVKVSPAIKSVSVFKTSDPTETPIIADTVVLKARHPGLSNYLVSKSNYRCHVWCGPMHAFEQGKLVIFPNTLLFFSLGCLLAIVLLWFRRILVPRPVLNASGGKNMDILQRFPILKKALISRWPQLILTFAALTMIYIVIIVGFFGTKMSGRNLGVLLMWAVWLFVLVAILTPLLGRSWCTICPLPFFGDWLQRGSLFSPLRGKTKQYQNKYFGLFLEWPKKLDNSWLRLFFFLILSTFSTTLIAKPGVSAITVLLLLLIPTIMALIWKLRAFCRYLCPVSVFITPFSGMSPESISSKDEEICNKCTSHFCEKGSSGGWACPYGLNIGKLSQNNDCGLCLECLRSCSYKNVTLVKKPFGQVSPVRNASEAWLSIAIFTISIVYSIVYLGTYTRIRDYVNILDKQNWDLFGIYTLVVWSLVLLVVPGVLYLLAYIASYITKQVVSVRLTFLNYSSLLLPLGMMLWVAFVIPMLFVNVTFIAQSASDPLGWGWDFFGTAGIPWHQFMPQYIPWLQAILVLFGLSLSLQNARRIWTGLSPQLQIKTAFPAVSFLVAVSVFMVVFFTN